ncbi:MAG: ABC transporter ATP-binding protein [bacterium]|nr:ABC transporter ATP-binding protein [bacterium]
MLEIKNLISGYDSIPVIKDINLKIIEGDICGIIGPNGSGKTTLIKVITKILPLWKGEILFENKNIHHIKINELAKKIAVVSHGQEYAFNMTVEDFVLLGRIPYRQKFQFWETKKDEQIITESMELTETVVFRNKFMNELSEGEKQLICIAQALTQEPKLLILDEPTAHLDINHQVKILNLIRKLNQKNGLTVIMVLHDLNLASEYCNKLILLNKGCLYKTGLPEEVLTGEIIEDVYNTKVLVKENPISSKPYVFVVPTP